MTSDDVAGAIGQAAPPAEGKKARRKRRPEPAIVEAVERLNQAYALVLVGDKALVVREATDARGRATVGFMTPDSFRLWNGTLQFYNGGDKPKGIGAIWLEHINRRQYDGVTFAPDGAPEGWYNLWRGFSVEPREGEPEKAFPTFLDHLRTNVANGNPAHFDYIVGWFAHMVQKPEERIGTALVLRGRQGSGKTKVGEAIGSLWGQHYIMTGDNRYITGQFNAHLANCLLLHADEGFWNGDRAVMPIVNALITSSEHFIERKGVDPVPIRNLVRLFVASDQSWAVPAQLDARRFAVFDVNDRCAQNVEYFAAIDTEMAKGGREVLLWWLQRFDLSKVDLRHVPGTLALMEQKILSLKPHEAWWRERLEEGSPTSIWPRWHHDDEDDPQPEEWPPAWTDDKQIEVPKDQLFIDYRRYAEKLRRRPLTKEQLGAELSQLLPDSVATSRPSVAVTLKNGAKEHRRPRCYVLPALGECRAHLDKLMRTETPWDTPGDAGDG